MAYIEIATSYSAPSAKAGLISTLVSMFRSGHGESAALKSEPAPRKLAGPLPGDRRARGYLDGLDGL